MPSNARIIRPELIQEDLDDGIVPPPYNNVGEVINIGPYAFTVSNLENMLGMRSTVDIPSSIKSYIMSNLSFPDKDVERELELKVDRILEALGRNNYTPTRGVNRTLPTHIVYLDDKSVEQFVNKISKCRYIKWKLASPIYWGVGNIGFWGVFKR